MYQTQINKLTGILERLQPGSSSSLTSDEQQQTFKDIMREEMQIMQQSFAMKIKKLQDEHQDKVNQLQKQIRCATTKQRNSSQLSLCVSAPPSLISSCTNICVFIIFML